MCHFERSEKSFPTLTIDFSVALLLRNDNDKQKKAGNFSTDEIGKHDSKNIRCFNTIVVKGVCA